MAGKAAAAFRGYQALIAELAPGYDPRHIEAFMRLQYSTLDHLSREEFAEEVKIGVACIKEGGVAMAEANARSFGL